MTANELLLWLSARKEGSWPQFRGAVEALELGKDNDDSEEDASLPLHQRVRYNLERLGHVEFDAAECEDGWRVVPPALALSEDGSGTIGVLCGARTVKLLESIEKEGYTLSLERTAHPECPDIVRIRPGKQQMLIEFARREGIQCQYDAPAALLSHLPKVSSTKTWRREALPAAGRDWDVRQFVIQRRAIGWRTVTVQEANATGAQGLFRFTRFQTPQYFLRESRETIALPGAVGKYYLLFRRRKSVVKYDPRARSLSVPAIFRPPLLTERALILCSGFPPSLSAVHGRRRLTYRDIPEEIAGIAAEILGQDLT